MSWLRYNRPRKVFRSFVTEWRKDNPGEPLPSARRIAQMTGLSRQSVGRFLSAMPSNNANVAQMGHIRKGAD